MMSGKPKYPNEPYPHHPDLNMENLEVCIMDPAKDRLESTLAAVWRILDDTRQSYRLAMESAEIDEGRVNEVQDTVLDYLTNNYGEC